MSTFKLMLKQIRKASGMTQKEVAEKANVSLGTYRTWEQGAAGMSLEMAFIVSGVLGCTPNDLCDWYATHPRENATQHIDPEHAELVGCYDQCTDDRKDSLMRQARDAAFMSREFSECAVPNAREA